MNNPETSQPSRRAAVYRLYDAGGTLLYIGSAYDPERRYVQHHAKHWWSQVARRTEEWHPSKPEAYAAEMAAIKAECPVHNEMGTPRYVPPATKVAARLGERRGELSLAQIAAKYDVSRQSLHAYRQRTSFPKPIPGRGTTRLRFREDEVDAFFVANPKRPGRRTDRETVEGDPMPTAPDPLPEMFGGLARLLAMSSRDWGTAREDAWLYGLFCGWDCEENHEHDELCDNGAAMQEMAERHGWDAETVARLRRYRAAVLASTGEAFPDPRFSGKPPTA